MKFHTLPLFTTLFLASPSLVASQFPVVVQHPDEHPWMPVYLHEYRIMANELDAVHACDDEANKNHNCDVVMFALLRDEDCVPRDFIMHMSNDEYPDALGCPMVVEGYSAYATQDTTGMPNKYHLTNVPGVEQVVYFIPKSMFDELEAENPDFTYGDLVALGQENKDVHRGYTTEFSELHYLNIVEDQHEGDFILVARGELDDGRTFSVHIDERGGYYVPYIWDIDLEPEEDSSDDDDDGLEEGGLAGAIVGSIVFGALVAMFAMMFFSCRKTSNQLQETHVKHKDAVEPTESNPHDAEPTESHPDDVEPKDV